MRFPFFKTKETKKSEMPKSAISDIGDASLGLRGGLDYIHFNSGDAAKIPAYPFTFSYLYELYRNSDILRIVIDTLRREIFRNGFEVREKYKLKCAVCGKEFQSMVDRCDRCGSTLLIRPSEEQRKIIEELITRPVNENGEFLIDVLHQLEIDLDVTDNAYLLIAKKYYYDESGEIVSAEIKELVRVPPQYVQIIADQHGRIGYDDQGRKLYVCPNKRDTIFPETEGTCSDGIKPIRAAYKISVSVMTGATFSYIDTKYYGLHEIIHLKKWMPGSLYGYSPIYAVWMKVMSLIYMDRYIMTYFQKQRPPRGIFVINSKSFDSVRKAWEWLMERARRNPHDIVPLIVQTEKPGRGTVQFIDLMRSPSEMEMTELRNEFRRAIGAIYGVLPLFTGDLPSGWANEGTQVLVTNRAVMHGQEIYNRYLFPRLLKMLGVTDWELRLAKPERKDEFKEIELLREKAKFLQQLKSMGFHVEFSHTGEMKWSKAPVTEVDRRKILRGVEDSSDRKRGDKGTRDMSGSPDEEGDWQNMEGAPDNVKREKRRAGDNP